MANNLNSNITRKVARVFLEAFEPGCNKDRRHSTPEWQIQPIKW